MSPAIMGVFQLGQPGNSNDILFCKRLQFKT